MEIYIQFRKTLFSLGSRGFRRMKTWDWQDVEEKFESLFEVQRANVQRVYESQNDAEKSMRKESKKQLLMVNIGAWRGIDDNAWPFDPEVDGNGHMGNEDGK